MGKYNKIKFKDKCKRFFYGRYGNDTLGRFLLWVYVGMVLLSMILSLFVEAPFLYVIYLLASTALVIYMFFRIFSRNIAARRRENEKFCGFFKLQKNKFRDRKTHVYRKCPKCHAVLRLPRAKGKHSVVCPRCRERFSVKG